MTPVPDPSAQPLLPWGTSASPAAPPAPKVGIQPSSAAAVQPMLPWGTSGDNICLAGKVERVLVERPTGWRMLLVEVQGRRDKMKWIGVMDRVVEGSLVQATGRIEEDRREKGAEVFVVDALLEQVPDNSDGLVAFVARLVPGIAKGRARQIVEKFGPMTVDIFDREPHRLAEVRGISAEKAAELGKAWADKRATATVILFLLNHGVKAHLARRIAEHFENRAQWVVENDPYQLTEVDGIAFKTADEIARAINVDPMSTKRAQAALVEVLNSETHARGHSYMPEDEAVSAAREIIDVPTKIVRDALEEMLSAVTPRVLRTQFHGQNVLMLPAIAGAEERVAKKLAKLAQAPVAANADDRRSPMVAHVDKAIASFERQGKITLAPAQREAIALAAREKVLVITGGPGVGKCLGAGTPVLMYDGSVRPAETVRDGDLLMGPDSKPRRVSGTTRGRGPLYEIRPIKGEPWVCNDAHILTLVRSGTDEIRDIPLMDWLALSHGAKWKVKGKLFRVGVDFKERHTPIDPYVMGLWLGNGARNSTRITTPFREVANYIHTAAHAAGCYTNENWIADKHCWDVDLSKNFVPRGPRSLKNPFREEFRRASVRDTKRMLPEYKLNSREVRMRLLAGLVDTDGHVEHGCIEVISKWIDLAEDIAFLARSLGMAATITPKSVQLEGWEAPRTYHRVVISGHLDEVPTIVPNRKVDPRQQVKDVTRTGFDAVPIGDGDYFGFQLDGDGRFLLGDFTVTHNTTILQGILHLFKSASVPVYLCAPTGRAAKRMNEATGHPAATIHRTLAYDPETRAFTHREGCPLPDCGAVVVDEVSMVDIKLAADLLAAVPLGARLLFIGDVDQLPSVGPGMVLRNLIDSEAIPVVRLTQIFRQADGSAIIDNAHRINAGKEPIGQDGTGKEVYVVRRASGKAAARTVIDLVANRIPAAFGIPVREIQVLTPMHKGDAGTLVLNQSLQEALNPKRDDEPEMVRGDDHFRLRDRVLHTKNDAMREVYNGDLGYVVSIVPASDAQAAELVVEFDDGPEARRVTYNTKQLKELKLAYAMSVHKSQGGSFTAVVQVLMPEHHMLLSRPLLYTGFTRPRKLVILVTEDRALRRALNETESVRRRTRLQDLLRDEMAATTTGGRSR